MYVLIIILVLLLNFTCIASSSSSSLDGVQSTKDQLPQAHLPNDNLQNTLPDLGNCSEYTDYYIYQCQPFTCSLPVANAPGVTREMKTIGFQNNKCLHKVTLKVRHSAFPHANINISCKLSETGRAEMANLFTRYKKGDLTAYTKRTLDPKLGKECHF